MNRSPSEKRSRPNLDGPGGRRPDSAGSQYSEDVGNAKGSPKSRFSWFRASEQSDVSQVSQTNDGLKRKSTWERLSAVYELAGAVSPFSRRSLIEEESSSDEEEHEDKIARLKQTMKLMRIKTKDLESKRDRAFQYFGTVEHPPEGSEPMFMRWQRRLGILEFRVWLEMKRVTIEEEPPYFKDLHEIVKSLRFEALIGVLILLNSICIAWDTFYDVDDRRPFILENAEHVFTAIFLVEWFMRICAFSPFWLWKAMNMFDTFLIWIAGVLVTWILLPAGIQVQAARRLGAFRILRLARVIRAIRLMKVFKELWMLVQGVMECSTLLIWAMVIGSLVHFTFAVAIVELISKSETHKDDEAVQEYFGTTVRAMFTLFQVMTLDSWSGIVRPIVIKTPLAMLLFGLFMGFASIVLFNLLTAIVVQNAYDAGDEDTEAVAAHKRQEQRKIREELLQTFDDLDEDGSGYLSQEEFVDCLDDYLFVRKMKMLDINLEELPDFFEILDDGDGQVDQNEFVEGMIKMQGPARAPEMLKATCMIRSQNAHFHKLNDSFVFESLNTFSRMEGDMERVHKGLNDIMQLTSEVMIKLDELGVRNIVRSTLKDVPFVREPTIDELTKLTKSDVKKGKKRAKAAKETPSEFDIQDMVPAEGKMTKLVPPSWIIREGRTYAAKNPGKVRLLTDPVLKQRIKKKQPKTERELPKSLIPKVRDEMIPAWENMEVPLDDKGNLRGVASVKDGTAQPPAFLHPVANCLESCLLPKSHTISVVRPPLERAPNSTEAPPGTAALEDAVQEIDAPQSRHSRRLSQRSDSQRSIEVVNKPFEHPNAVLEETLM